MSANATAPVIKMVSAKAAQSLGPAAAMLAGSRATGEEHASQRAAAHEGPAQPDAPLPGGAAGAYQLATINEAAESDVPESAQAVLEGLPEDSVIEPTAADDLAKIEPASGPDGGSSAPGNTGHGTTDAGLEGPLAAFFGVGDDDGAGFDGAGALAGTSLDIADPLGIGNGSDEEIIDVSEAAETSKVTKDEPVIVPKTELIFGTGGADTLDLRDVDLSTVIEVDAGAGNDTILASNLTEGAYRGGSGNDTLTAGSEAVTWLYKGTNNGFDTLNNGSGTSIALAQGAGAVIGVNGYANGVDQFQGVGDTIIRDSNSSRTLNFSNTTLTGIAEIDAAGGNDTVTASNLSDGAYRGGAGNDTLNAGTTSVTWLYKGTNNGFDTLKNGAGTSVALAQGAGTVIGVNGYANGVDQFQGSGDTIIRDSNSSRTLNFSNTTLTGIAEIDAAGGNDTVTASNLSDGVYRGGAGDDTLNAGTTGVTWLYNGAGNGFDTLKNGSGTSIALAQGAGTVIGLNGFNNGVDQFQGAGDTIIRDSNSSRTLNFSNTLLSGISEIDAAGGNDTVTASNLSDGAYRGGAGNDTLNAGTTDVTWLYNGASNGFDTLKNGAGTSIALAQGAGTVIGLNGFANGVDQFQGAGDTVLLDSNSSRRIDLSDTSLSGIVEVDAAGGNDVVATALSNGAAITYDGGAGTDTLRLSLTNAQAADAATLAEIAAYKSHLAGANHADPFTFSSLGITVEKFESLKLNNVIKIGGDIGPASGTADSIDITLNDVLDLTTEASNPLLTILGDANDQVTLNGGWTQQANADGFSVFTQSVSGVGVVTLRVDDDVQSVVVAP